VSTFYADPSEPAYIEQCQKAGLPVEAAQNDVLPGLNAVAEELSKGMRIAPHCTGLLDEIPGYTWKTSRMGPTERPIEINDDACDALRYAVMALHNPTIHGWGAVEGRVGGVV